MFIYIYIYIYIYSSVRFLCHSMTVLVSPVLLMHATYVREKYWYKTFYLVFKHVYIPFLLSREFSGSSITRQNSTQSIAVQPPKLIFSSDSIVALSIPLDNDTQVTCLHVIQRKRQSSERVIFLS